MSVYSSCVFVFLFSLMLFYCRIVVWSYQYTSLCIDFLFLFITLLGIFSLASVSY